MRVATACQACRARKQRCQIDNSSPVICNHCRQEKIVCSLSSLPITRVSQSNSCRRQSVVSRNGKARFPPTSQTTSTSIPQLPPRDVCNDLIRIFFDTLHHTQSALFHRRSFMEAYKEHNVPMILLLGIYALTARFSDHSYFDGIERWERGSEWGITAKRMLNLQNMEVSLTTLQACHLVSALANGTGDSETESLCSSIANRITQLLELPSRRSRDPIQQEIEIRAFWTIYMMDIWASTGLNLKRSFEFNPSWPWPLEETAFEQLTDTSSVIVHLGAIDNDDDLRRLSMWGQMIPLSNLKAQIHDLNEQFLNRTSSSDVELLEYVSNISSQLDQWALTLPSRLQETEENLAHFARSGLGHVFAALHIGYHYHAILLYYRFLHQEDNPAVSNHQTDTRQSLPPPLEYARRCKSHAAAISKLTWISSEKYNCNCVWLLISHVLVISSSVHLHTLLLETDPSAVSKARTLLEQNFQMLTKLRLFWPWVDLSMARLKAFQEACLQAARTEDVYKMDSWLSKFLHEHAAPIGNETVGPPSLQTSLFALDNWDFNV